MRMLLDPQKHKSKLWQTSNTLILDAELKSLYHCCSFRRELRPLLWPGNSLRFYLGANQNLICFSIDWLESKRLWNGSCEITLDFLNNCQLPGAGGFLPRRCQKESGLCVTMTSFKSPTNKCSTSPSHRPATNGPWAGVHYTCRSPALLDGKKLEQLLWQTFYIAQVPLFGLQAFEDCFL